MSLVELLKKFGYQIGVLGLASALIGAALTWWAISTGDADLAIANTVANLMMILVVAIPLVFFGLCYREQQIIRQTKRSTAAIALGIIGLAGGAFASMVYFYVGFQLPTVFTGADMFVIFDVLVPALFSWGIAVLVVTAITGVAISFWMTDPQ